jgi:hypothetical protein
MEWPGKGLVEGQCTTGIRFFAECHVVCRVFFLRALGKEALCRVLNKKHLAKKLLCRVQKKTLGKDILCRVPKKILGKEAALPSSIAVFQSTF